MRMESPSATWCRGCNKCGKPNCEACIKLLYYLWGSGELKHLGSITVVSVTGLASLPFWLQTPLLNLPAALPAAQPSEAHGQVLPWQAVLTLPMEKFVAFTRIASDDVHATSNRCMNVHQLTQSALKDRHLVLQWAWFPITIQKSVIVVKACESCAEIRNRNVNCTNSTNIDLRFD